MDKIETQTVMEWLDTMATALREQIADTPLSDVVMIGIHSGGVRIAEQLHPQLSLDSDLGTLNITFYRDDFSRIGLHPRVEPSQLPFDIENKTVILIDDVLYSGRTIRAAMNEIFDYGRPARIILGVLVERKGHELPIRADVKGCQLALATSEQIKLLPNELALTRRQLSDKEG